MPATAVPFVPATTDVDTLCDRLLGQFPWINVDRSTLGGEDRASLFVKVSLDPKETWQNGILENSRWALFGVQSGKLYMVAGSKVPKFRKCDAKSANNIVDKILTWREKTF